MESYANLLFVRSKVVKYPEVTATGEVLDTENCRLPD